MGYRDAVDYEPCAWEGIRNQVFLGDEQYRLFALVPMLSNTSLVEGPLLFKRYRSLKGECILRLCFQIVRQVYKIFTWSIKDLAN